MRTKAILAAASIASLLALAPAAGAATKPAVTTGATSQLSQTGVTLTGKVDPKGSATSYTFQYGTTKSYGAQSGLTAAGSGNAAVTATAAITGLTPATTYHYRLVATNVAGTTLGADKSFKTAKQPLGLTLTASPNPAPFSAPITLSGQLTGTGGPGRSVQLQQNAFPYTAGFAPVGNAQVTDSSARFSFSVLSLTQNTQFRVVTTSSPLVVSPIVIAGSAIIVKVHVGTHRMRSGSRLKFSGSVTPREDGALYAVQRRHDGTQWTTVAGSSLRRSSTSSTKSSYAKRVRIRHSGVYRIFVGVADGSHVSNTSKSVHIKVVPRR